MAKVSMNLTDQDIEKVDRLAGARGVTKTDAVRSAIATEDFLREQLVKGSKILIKDPDGSIRELYIR